MKTFIINILILLSFSFNNMNAQNHNNLINGLAENNLLDEKFTHTNSQSILTEIYLSETQNRESLRYMKRRRFYTGPELTQRAEKIITTVAKHQYINDSAKNKMLSMLKKPDDNNIEYLVDNISVWQYLSEMELYNLELSKKRLENYALELIEYKLIDTITHVNINSYKEFVTQLKNTVIIEVSDVPDFSKIQKELNSKDNIKKLGLNKSDYQIIEPLDISRFREINNTLKEKELEFRILTLSDKDDLTWFGLIMLNLEQYKVVKRWDKGYEYPFFNVDWFVVKVYPEEEFE